MRHVASLLLLFYLCRTNACCKGKPVSRLAPSNFPSFPTMPKPVSSWKAAPYFISLWRKENTESDANHDLLLRTGDCKPDIERTHGQPRLTRVPLIHYTNTVCCIVLFRSSQQFPVSKQAWQGGIMLTCLLLLLLLLLPHISLQISTLLCGTSATASALSSKPRPSASKD